MKAVRDLTYIACRSITFDCGTEFVSWPHLQSEIGTQTWFCDPSSPWQKQISFLRESLGRINVSLRDTQLHFFEYVNFGKDFRAMSAHTQISLRCLATALMLLFLSVTAGHAQTLVEPGSVVIVARSNSEITNVDTPKGEVVVSSAEDGTYRLIFVAPEDIPADPVEVTYEINGESETRLYTVLAGSAVFGSDQVYDAALKALFILFILAVVVESGLQLVFRWRPYLVVFNTAGANALIAFAFSWFFVGFFQLDIASRLVNAYLGNASGFANSTVGYVLTAMIIAGGSAGVNRLFRSFGIRPIAPPEEVSGPEDQTTAWISVSVERLKAKGDVTVLYGKPGEEAVIGTINGSSGQSWLKSMLFRDRGRFPQCGGYRVDTSDQPRTIKIVAQDAQDKQIRVADWGPFPIGPRAIIDVMRQV